jgi:hypothetical protein
MFRNADLRDIKVGTVDDYQGQEGKVIFVSTTVSRRYGFADFRGDAAAVSFVGNPQRFNVALSRAQHMLVIVGDPWVLNMDRCACVLLVVAGHTVERSADAGEHCFASASATERTKAARCRRH